MEEWQIQLLKDHNLIKILDKQFNEEEYILNILNHTTSSELSEIFSKLSNAKQSISQSFAHTINNNYNRLIDDFQNLKDLNFEISDCKIRMQTIHKSVGNINTNLMQNFENIQTKTPILQNTGAALVMARRALKFLQHLKKLRSALGPKNEILDLNKACVTMKDIIQIVGEQNLDGVEFYEKEKDFLNQIREQIIDINDKKFARSISSRNIVEVTHCVQNFYNLRILTDRIQNAATNIMKSINEEWKKFLYHEFEKPPNGLIIMSNMLKTLIQEQQNYHMQLWILSTILRKRESNSLDSFFEYMKKGKIRNLYDMVWQKQIGLMIHHLDKFKEEKADPNPRNVLFNNNRLLLIRIYPKLLNQFTEFIDNLSYFILKNPDPHELKDIQELKTQCLDPLVPFAELYYKFIENEIRIRSKSLSEAIFNNEAFQFKNYTGPIMQEVARLTQFVNYELKDNIRNDEILNKFSRTVMNTLQEQLEITLHRYDKAEAGTLSLNRIFVLFLFLSEIRKIVIGIITPKCIEDSHLKLVDKFNELCLKSESHLLELIFQTLFENTIKHLDTLFEFYSKEGAKLVSDNKSINNLFEFLNNYSVASNKTLENHIEFNSQWNRFLNAILNLLGMIFSTVKESDNKTLELVNADIETMGYIVDSFQKKDSTQRLHLLNLQKLILIDIKSMKQFIENKHELIQTIPHSIIFFNFFKRLEREQNITLSSVLEKEKDKSLISLLGTYFQAPAEKNLIKIYELFSDTDKIKERLSQYEQLVSEKKNINLSESSNMWVLKAL